MTNSSRYLGYLHLHLHLNNPWERRKQNEEKDTKESEDWNENVDNIPWRGGRTTKQILSDIGPFGRTLFSLLIFPWGFNRSHFRGLSLPRCFRRHSGWGHRRKKNCGINKLISLIMCLILTYIWKLRHSLLLLCDSLCLIFIKGLATRPARSISEPVGHCFSNRVPWRLFLEFDPFLL